MTITRERWTSTRAWAWYHRHPVPYGCNFLPSTAINATEMWQAETFDARTIDHELSLAARAGFNSCRVFMQYLVWQDDSQALKQHLDTFLSIAARHGISTVPIIFDDCAFAGKEPHLGPQDEPVPGVHNSGWTPSPGPSIADDLTARPRLEAYVRDVVGSFATDRRVLLWDLYNEPGNAKRGPKSRPLLEQTFAWARASAPAQPLTSGAWGGAGTDDVCLALSDVTTFHHYDDAAALRARIATLKTQGRPLICTEWMARPLHSVVATHLPLFAEHQIGCYLWGLVNGRTQTHIPWGLLDGATESDLWFHDLFHPDGTPYSLEEVATIRRFSAAFTAVPWGTPP